MILNLDKKLPEGWKWVKLGEVCHIASGSTPQTSVAEYWNGDICWITPTDLGKLSNSEIYDSARKITKAGYDNSGTELIPPGSVVMSSRAPIGHLGIAKVSLCTNQGCKSFVPGPHIETSFLYYALKISVKALQSLGSGATFTEVSKSQVEYFEIPLPPLHEQKRIAAILSEQIAAIEKARAAAEARLEAAKALPAAYLREVFESPIVNDWKETKVNDIVSLVIDGPHVTPLYQPVGIPFLTVRNIVNRRIDMNNVSYISESDHQQFAKRGKPERGDILYTKDGTMGVPCLVERDEECSFFVSVALIKLLREKADPLFITFALESPSVLTQVERLGAGAGLKHMVLRSIRALKLKLPSLSEQRKIAARLKDKMTKANQLSEAIKEESKTIKSLPSALLRRAFNGEL